MIEPFGDNSRLWVVPADPDAPVDLSIIEQAFATSYSPGDPLGRLRFFRSFLPRRR